MYGRYNMKDTLQRNWQKIRSIWLSLGKNLLNLRLSSYVSKITERWDPFVKATSIGGPKGRADMDASPLISPIFFFIFMQVLGKF